jgi:GMP synthase (glutamine-hydrolysing)
LSWRVLPDRARGHTAGATHYPSGVTIDPTADLVLVVDYGAQYAQLIARRVREARVYSEIVPHDTPVADILARRPKAVILSGGPSSVYAPGAPQAPTDLVSAGVPTLGICYGFQAMAQALGGTVARTGRSEFGRTPLSVTGTGGVLGFVPRPGSR